MVAQLAILLLFAAAMTSARCIAACVDYASKPPCHQRHMPKPAADCASQMVSVERGDDVVAVVSAAPAVVEAAAMRVQYEAPCERCSADPPPQNRAVLRV